MYRRKSLINQAIRRHFTITLTNNEGVFAGILTESDADTWVFEQCTTPKGEEIAGRIFIDRLNVAYLQEIS